MCEILYFLRNWPETNEHLKSYEAVLSALEPLTHCLSGQLFGEMFTTRLMIGIVLFLVAVLIIALGKNL